MTDRDRTGALDFERPRFDLPDQEQAPSDDAQAPPQSSAESAGGAVPETDQPWQHEPPAPPEPAPEAEAEAADEAYDEAYDETWEAPISAPAPVEQEPWEDPAPEPTQTEPPSAGLAATPPNAQSAVEVVPETVQPWEHEPPAAPESAPEPEAEAADEAYDEPWEAPTTEDDPWDSPPREATQPAEAPEGLFQGMLDDVPGQDLEDPEPAPPRRSGGFLKSMKRGGKKPKARKPRRTKSDVGEDDDTTTPRQKRPYRTRKVRTADGGKMAVPAPGGALKGDRGVAIVGRAAVYVTAFAVLASALFLGGILAVSALRDQRVERSIPPADVEKYHLTEWNVDAGAAFAGKYLRLCLWQPKGRDSDQRLTSLDAMNASDANDCAYTGEGTDGRYVENIVYSGYNSPIDGTPGARYVGMDVETSDGTIASYVVPVWLANPATGEGPRVIGGIGVMPPQRMGSPSPSLVAEKPADDDLSQVLAATFIPQFMDAWAQSDQSALGQFLSSDASLQAETGLNGAYTDPAVTEVIAYAPSEAIVDGEFNEDYQYETGENVEVAVTVTMTNAGTGSRQDFEYRVTVQRSGSHWFVSDIDAGLTGYLDGSGEGAAVDQNEAPGTATEPAPTEETSTEESPTEETTSPQPSEPKPSPQNNQSQGTSGGGDSGR